MPQDTIFEMLHRPRSLPPFSEEEQALMNAMAEREHAETRERRTAERPGISDAAWRAAYGVADVVDPAIGSIADLAIGATVGADPFARSQPIWEQRPSMQELGETIATAVMPLASPLRKAAYRTLMLKKLRAQIEKLEPGAAKQMFNRLTETHPRVMAALEHSGGVIQRDPAYSAKVVRDAIANEEHPTRFGIFRQRLGTDRVPGLRDVREGPSINVTPQSFVDSLDPSQHRLGSRAHIDYEPGIDMGSVAAHETTHWAQHLGGRGKRELELLDEMNLIAEKFKALPEADKKSEVWAAISQKLKKQGELRQIQDHMEAGADIAGPHQSQRMRDELPRRLLRHRKYRRMLDDVTRD